MTKPKDDLNPRQRAFVNEYAVDMNATRAAAAAGYSERTANEQGCGLLKITKIRAAVDKALAAKAERAEVTANYVIERLKVQADAEGPGTTHSGRVRALELLGKSIGLFTEKLEVDDRRPVGLGQAVKVQVRIGDRKPFELGTREEDRGDEEDAVPALEE